MEMISCLDSIKQMNKGGKKISLEEGTRVGLLFGQHQSTTVHVTTLFMLHVTSLSPIWTQTNTLQDELGS